MRTTGVADMRRKLEALMKASPKIQAAALTQEGEHEMGLMKPRVPVKTGTLRSTGRVEEPIIKPDVISVDMVFGGGPAADYAIPVHEDLSAHHDEGQAKYAESVMNEEEKGAPGRIAQSIWSGLKESV